MQELWRAPSDGIYRGEVTCGYCGTVNVFSPRKEEPVEPVAAISDITEEERMTLLNRQDGTQPEIPPAVGQLLPEADWLPGRRVKLCPCGGSPVESLPAVAISAAPSSSTSSQ